MAASPSTFRCRKIDKYDGQYIFSGSKVVYELGNYLGGGASGSVYQAFEPTTDRSVAVKILNPLGYKNTIVGQISRCPVAQKGQPLSVDQIHGKCPMKLDNIWWLMHPTSKQLFAAYEDPHRVQLRELPLPKCVEIWGLNPLGVDQRSENEVDKRNFHGQGATTVVMPGDDGKRVIIPEVSPKYLKFLRSRQSVCREMSNMIQIGEHPNIIDLFEVLELVQDTKTTLFLVLELVNGGELFERMKAGGGGGISTCTAAAGASSEDWAKRYFRQLISGIDYCHKQGVVHRDLKPENLLLSDPSDSAILKIADFGLSAVVFATESSSHVKPTAAASAVLSPNQLQQQQQGAGHSANNNFHSHEQHQETNLLGQQQEVLNTRNNNNNNNNNNNTNISLPTTYGTICTPPRKKVLMSNTTVASLSPLEESVDDEDQYELSPCSATPGLEVDYAGGCNADDTLNTYASTTGAVEGSGSVRSLSPEKPRQHQQHQQHQQQQHSKYKQLSSKRQQPPCTQESPQEQKEREFRQKEQERDREYQELLTASVHFHDDEEEQVEVAEQLPPQQLTSCGTSSPLVKEENNVNDNINDINNSDKKYNTHDNDRNNTWRAGLNDILHRSNNSNCSAEGYNDDDVFAGLATPPVTTPLLTSPGVHSKHAQQQQLRQQQHNIIINNNNNNNNNNNKRQNKVHQISQHQPSSSLLPLPSDDSAPITAATTAVAAVATPPPALRRLRSVVGSPHYIAPEIASHDPAGYDGRKVDMWSAGIILYSLLTGALPFGSDICTCPRYKRYKQWLSSEFSMNAQGQNGSPTAERGVHGYNHSHTPAAFLSSIDGTGKPIIPHWFLPQSISAAAGELLIQLLHYDPRCRLTAAEVLQHPWCRERSFSLGTGMAAATAAAAEAAAAAAAAAAGGSGLGGISTTVGGLSTSHYNNSSSSSRTGGLDCNENGIARNHATRGDNDNGDDSNNNDFYGDGEKDLPSPQRAHSDDPATLLSHSMSGLNLNTFQAYSSGSVTSPPPPPPPPPHAAAAASPATTPVRSPSAGVVTQTATATATAPVTASALLPANAIHIFSEDQSLTGSIGIYNSTGNSHSDSRRNTGDRIASTIANTLEEVVTAVPLTSTLDVIDNTAVDALSAVTAASSSSTGNNAATPRGEYLSVEEQQRQKEEAANDVDGDYIL